MRLREVGAGEAADGGERVEGEVDALERRRVRVLRRARGQRGEEELEVGVANLRLLEVESALARRERSATSTKAALGGRPLQKAPTSARAAAAPAALRSSSSVVSCGGTAAASFSTSSSLSACRDSRSVCSRGSTGSTSASAATHAAPSAPRPIAGPPRSSSSSCGAPPCEPSVSAAAELSDTGLPARLNLASAGVLDAPRCAVSASTAASSRPEEERSTLLISASRE